MKFLTMLPLFLHFITLLLLSSVPTISHGLILKLIPPSSPESPYYLGNLSFWERTHLYIQQSNARAHYLHSRALAYNNNNSSSSSQISAIAPPVQVQHYGLYSVKIGIGKIPAGGGRHTFKSYYLVMDTGSDLIWLQCADCKKRGNKCFSQQGEPPFPSGDSTTFHLIECARDRKICSPHQCDGKVCYYDNKYADGSHSKGFLAHELFTFDADRGKLETKDLRFGCGFDQEKVLFAEHPGNKLAGILGLNTRPDALHMQLESETNKKFSYCLPHIDSQAHVSYLSFGADIKQTPDFLTTQLITDKSGSYKVFLEGVSMNHHKLGAPLPPKSKAIVDSGSTVSRLIKPAYDVLEKAIVRLFSGDPTLKKMEERKDFLCYQRVVPQVDMYSGLPTLTFHLAGADYDIGPDGVFDVETKNGKQAICMLIAPDDTDSYIGAFQQANRRLIYDLGRNQLLFKNEVC